MNSPKDEIKKMWRIFGTNKSSVHELRAFHHKDKSLVKRNVFRSSDFTSPDDMKEAFEKMALELNNHGYNIYITLNPINQDFNGGSAKDIDIDFRDLLLIDIDRDGGTENPATDEEVENAKELAGKVIIFLSELGWAKPFQVMSGNGWHLYYILEGLENNDDVRDLVQLTLKYLNKEFNNKKVKIDTIVYNAGRITKVPGTIMRKGEETPDRPYRMAVVYG
jgi:hypothetical protein